MQAIVVPVFTFAIVVVVGLVNLIDALRGLLDEPQPATKPTAATNPDARTTFTLGIIAVLWSATKGSPLACASVLTADG